MTRVATTTTSNASDDDDDAPATREDLVMRAALAAVVHRRPMDVDALCQALPLVAPSTLRADAELAQRWLRGLLDGSGFGNTAGAALSIAREDYIVRTALVAVLECREMELAWLYAALPDESREELRREAERTKRWLVDILSGRLFKRGSTKWSLAESVRSPTSPGLSMDRAAGELQHPAQIQQPRVSGSQPCELLIAALESLVGNSLNDHTGSKSQPKFLENQASSKPAPRPRPNRKRIRYYCTAPGCDRVAKTAGKCCRHGGSRRCTIEGCERMVQTDDRCVRHGARRVCKEPGCPNHIQSNGKCRRHGGGPRCNEEGCGKSANLGGKCCGHRHKIPRAGETKAEHR